eukprot:4517545-Pyramimonas_sp.AAC.1
MTRVSDRGRGSDNDVGILGASLPAAREARGIAPSARASGPLATEVVAPGAPTFGAIRRRAPQGHLVPLASAVAPAVPTFGDADVRAECNIVGFHATGVAGP